MTGPFCHQRYPGPPASWGGGQGLKGTESSPGSEQAQSDPWDPAQDRGQVLATQRLLSEVGRPSGRWRTEREVYHQAWVCRV